MTPTWYALVSACMLCVHEVRSLCTQRDSFTSPDIPAYFYSFGTDVGDMKLSDAMPDEISPGNTLTTKFIYLNKGFTTFYVSSNGLLSVGTPVQPQAANMKFPNAKALIAPYLMDITLSNNGGAVYYRTAHDTSILKRATSEITRRFSTPLKYMTAEVGVVTWVDVTHSAGDCNSSVSTFQAVLATDGRYSFVTFNYAGLTGTDDAASVDKPVAGLNFDADNVFVLPGSGFANVTELVTSSNVDINGVWSFRVDSKPFVTSLCDDAATLSLSPPMASPQGGTLLRLSGPCLTNTTLKAMVGNKDVTVTYLEPHSAQLVVPQFWRLGEIIVKLSTDDGSTYPHEATLLLGVDETAVPVVTRKSPDDWVKASDHVTVTWDADVIDAAFVDVFFVSYKIITDVVKEMKFILAMRQENNGSADIPVDGLPLVDKNDIDLVTFGSILIQAAEHEHVMHDVRIYSDMHVCMWFVRITLIEFVVRNRYEDLNTDPNEGKSYILTNIWTLISSKFEGATGNNMEIKDHIKSMIIDMCPMRTAVLLLIGDKMCPSISAVPVMTLAPPCSYKQSLSDPGWTDYSVQWIGKGCGGASTQKCTMQTVPNAAGASQKACYNGKGFMDDTLKAPLPISSHPNGLTTANSIIKRWMVDHFLLDVQPLIYCCAWGKTDNSKCAKATTTSCDNYRAHGQGGGGGDPHVVTFTGDKYTFNGIGEYVLTKHQDGFEVQARIQQRKSLLASQVTSVAMKNAESDILEVRTSSDLGLELLISKKLIELTGVTPLHFKDVTCHLKFDGPLLLSVEVVFSTNELVKITQYDGALQYVILPLDSFKGKLVGLLGEFDKGKDSTNTIDTAAEVLAFANTAKTTAAVTLFTYPVGKSHVDYQDESFVPTDPNPDMPMPDECGGDKFCAYDFNITQDMDFAIATRSFSEELEAIQHNFNSGRNCEPLMVVSGTVGSQERHVGDKITINCDPLYEALGTDERECLADLTWSGNDTNCTLKDACKDVKCMNKGICKADSTGHGICECKHTFTGLRCEKKLTDPRIIIGVASAVGAVLLLSISGIVFLICRSRPAPGNHHTEILKEAYPDYDSRYGIPVFRGSAVRRNSDMTYNNSYSPFGGEKQHANHRHFGQGYPQYQRHDKQPRAYHSNEIRGRGFPLDSLRGSDNEDSIDKIYRGEVPAKYNSQPPRDFETPYSSHIDMDKRRSAGRSNGDDYNRNRQHYQKADQYRDQRQERKYDNRRDREEPRQNQSNWVLKQ